MTLTIAFFFHACFYPIMAGETRPLKATFHGGLAHTDAFTVAISFSNTSTSSIPISTPSYLNWDFDGPDAGNPFDDIGQLAHNFTDVSYRKSPQCTSDFNSYSSAHPQITRTFAATTYTETYTETDTFSGPTVTETHTLTETDSSFTFTGAPELGCCGYGCAIYYHSVSVKYWPVSDSNSDCLTSQASSGSQSASDTHSVTATPTSSKSNSSASQTESNEAVAITVGPDGFT